MWFLYDTIPRSTEKNFYIQRTQIKKQADRNTTPICFKFKKRFLCFSKRVCKEIAFLKKINVGFIKQTLFLLKMLFIDFTIFIKQRIIKKIRVLYKKTIKKAHNISKHTEFFIKNTIFIFLPQNNLKQ